jgi:hypothetical protein
VITKRRFEKESVIDIFASQKRLNQFENISISHCQFIRKQEKSNINIKVDEEVKLINELE